MNNTFMKKKPILPLLASMAMPMVLSMLVNSLYNIVDSFFVAKISEQAMTALSLVFPVQNFINAVAIGFGVGINAQISFQLGAKNIKNANIAATHGMLFNIIHGIIFTVICIPFMPVFLSMFTKEQEVISSGVQYSTIAFCIFHSDHDQPVLRKDFSGCGQNETDNDQSDDRLYFQYYPGSAADFRSGDFSGNGDQRCSTGNWSWPGIYSYCISDRI